MAIHWTDFPPCVELFGDLFAVFETLEQRHPHGFEDFPEHRDKAAYDLQRRGGMWVVIPRPERMPGLEQLLERLEREGRYTLTFDLMRDLRRRTLNAMQCDRATVNAMTFTEIADTLDAAECRAQSATPRRAQSANPTPVPLTITPSRAALDEACRLTLDALRASRTLPIHRERFDRPNCTPTLRERCDTVGDQISAARAGIAGLVLTFRAVTRYVADRPFCNKFWSSAHEAAVEAANDLLLRFHPDCGDPGQTPEDRVYALLESEVEKEHAAVVAHCCTDEHELPAPEHAASDAPDEIKTFGEFLQNVRAVEVCAARTREDGNSKRGCPSSMWYAIQIDVFEATAQYKQHPAYPALEAYVNQRYGAFTHANLIRVRGEFCTARHCGSTDAEQIPVEEIVTALCCPGTPFVSGPAPTSSARQVITRPASVEPPRQYVEAAMRVLPGVLNNAPAPSGVHDPAGRKGTGYTILRQQLEARSFNRDAVEWAIHQHVEAGRLEAAPGVTSTSGVYRDGGWAMKPVTNPTYDRELCALWARPALWEWWKAIESGQPVSGVSMSTNPKIPPEAKSAEQPQAGYTMQDIRDLLCYQRECANFEQWKIATSRTNYSPSEWHTKACVMALNSPIARRLSEDKAASLAVFRRLVKACHDEFHRGLDEPALLYFVGEVADWHKHPVEEMWPLSVENFGCMMAAATSAVPTNLPAGVAPEADGNETQEPAPAVQERKLSERQKVILTEMFALGAVGSTKKTTRNEVVQRIDKKKTGADFARDFGALKEGSYTDSDAGPDGGVWLTGKGKTKAEELKEENEQ